MVRVRADWVFLNWGSLERIVIVVGARTGRLLDDGLTDFNLTVEALLLFLRLRRWFGKNLRLIVPRIIRCVLNCCMCSFLSFFFMADSRKGGRRLWLWCCFWLATKKLVLHLLSKSLLVKFKLFLLHIRVINVSLSVSDVYVVSGSVLVRSIFDS